MRPILRSALDQRLNRLMAQRSSLVVDQSNLDVRSADINADEERRLGLIQADKLAGVGHAAAGRFLKSQRSRWGTAIIDALAPGSKSD